jgi:hypothetical protein
MFQSRILRILLGAFVLIIGGMAIGNIEVDAPIELQGNHQVTGQIMSCDFGSLTKHSSKFFLGITLSAKDAPYLRVNPLLREKQYYKEMCNSHSLVTVTYAAKNRLVGPIRFWVQEIAAIKT